MPLLIYTAFFLTGCLFREVWNWLIGLDWERDPQERIYKAWREDFDNCFKLKK